MATCTARKSYQNSEKWLVSAQSSGLSTKGVASQGDQEWRWQVEIKEAMGNDLYRYEAQVGAKGAERDSARLFVYLVEKN